MGRTHRTMSKVIKTSSMKLCALCFLGFAICLMFPIISSEAKVTGSCSNCHTMHNSQGGQPVARGDAPWEGTGGSTDARPSLLIACCLGCHSSTTAGQSTKVISGSIIPIVFNTVEPTYGANGLAAGNFFYVSTNYVSTNIDNTGHNIFSTNPDGTLGNTPPGGSFPSGGV